MVKRLLYDEIEYIKRSKFSKIKSSTEEKIPDRIKEIFSTAQINYNFLSKKDFSVKKIEFSDDITEIETYAIAHCPELEKVILSDSIKILKEYAFNCDYSLNSINVDNINTIEQYVFAGCTALKTLKLTNSLSKLGESAFAASGLEKITLPNSLKEIEAKTFQGCIYLKEITLPKNLEKIGNLAFFSCGKLKSIKLPNTLKHIGLYAFRGCDSLEEVILPDNIEFIDELAFGYCKNLKRIIWRGNIYEDKVIFQNTLKEQKITKDLVWF